MRSRSQLRWRINPAIAIRLPGVQAQPCMSCSERIWLSRRVSQASAELVPVCCRGVWLTITLYRLQIFDKAKESGRCLCRDQLLTSWKYWFLSLAWSLASALDSSYSLVTAAPAGTNVSSERHSVSIKCQNPSQTMQLNVHIAVLTCPLPKHELTSASATNAACLSQDQLLKRYGRCQNWLITEGLPVSAQGCLPPFAPLWGLFCVAGDAFSGVAGDGVPGVLTAAAKSILAGAGCWPALELLLPRDGKFSSLSSGASCEQEILSQWIHTPCIPAIGPDNLDSHSPRMTVNASADASLNNSTRPVSPYVPMSIQNFRGAMQGRFLHQDKAVCVC